ncbi:MAG TPA: hypothetical protein VKG78_02300 [Opitutaceae bacterium]|nr:hypothetical protein [Opitutaceae bacterium]
MSLYVGTSIGACSIVIVGAVVKIGHAIFKLIGAIEENTSAVDSLTLVVTDMDERVQRLERDAA